MEDRVWFERETLSALPDLYGTALRLAKNAADAEDTSSTCFAPPGSRAWSS